MGLMVLGVYVMLEVNYWSTLMSPDVIQKLNDDGSSNGVVWRHLL